MPRKLAILILLMLPLGVFVDFGPRTASGQTGSFRALSSFYVLVGETVYHLDPGNAPIGWHQMPYGSFTLPPVPASSLLTLESGVAITQSGEGWIDTGAGGWQSVGQVPGSVATKQSSWGELKAKYR